MLVVGDGSGGRKGFGRVWLVPGEGLGIRRSGVTVDVCTWLKVRHILELLGLKISGNFRGHSWSWVMSASE